MVFPGWRKRPAPRCVPSVQRLSAFEKRSCRQGIAFDSISVAITMQLQLASAMHLASPPRYGTRTIHKHPALLRHSPSLTFVQAALGDFFSGSTGDIVKSTRPKPKQLSHEARHGGGRRRAFTSWLCSPVRGLESRELALPYLVDHGLKVCFGSRHTRSFTLLQIYIFFHARRQTPEAFHNISY